MELDIFNTNNSNEISEVIPVCINEKNFERITKIVDTAFKRLGINTKEKCLYYQRYGDLNSVLAIKVSNGDDRDTNNYMFVGSSVNYYNDSLSCDVYVHANAKSAMKTNDILSLISKDITNFFEETERDLLKANQTNLELSLKIPLGKTFEQQNEEKGIKRLIKTVFKK